MSDAASVTGGFLAPLNPPSAYDLDLAAQIQVTVAGITGIDGTLVRPRWQAKPPVMPHVTVNWVAVGATDIRSDDNANTIHDGHSDGGDGSDTAYRGEEITVLASFYGPQASGYAALLRDGFAVQQNRAAMLALGLAYAKPGALRNVSGLVLTENLIRYDFEFWLRRRPGRVYAVPSIRSVSGVILGQQGSPQGPQIGVDPFSVG